MLYKCHGCVTIYTRKEHENEKRKNANHLQIILSDWLKNSLREEAKLQKRSLNNLINVILEEHVNEKSDDKNGK